MTLRLGNMYEICGQKSNSQIVCLFVYVFTFTFLHVRIWQTFLCKKPEKLFVLCDNCYTLPSSTEENMSLNGVLCCKLASQRNFVGPWP